MLPPPSLPPSLHSLPALPALAQGYYWADVNTILPLSVQGRYFPKPSALPSLLGPELFGMYMYVLARRCRPMAGPSLFLLGTGENCIHIPVLHEYLGFNAT